MSPEARQLVHDTVRAWPRLDRLIFTLHHTEDLTDAEIGLALAPAFGELSPNQVSVIRRRREAELRARLAEAGRA